MSIASRSNSSRREFLQSSATALAVGAIGRGSEAAKTQDSARQAVAGQRPLIVASANGLRKADAQGPQGIERAMIMLNRGADPLDAVVAAVMDVEDDPNDHSVGLGGIPNEDGVVELDASVMHGPTHKAGAVAALRNVRHASAVARAVMQRTDHVLLVGEGALRFARAHGFKEEDLLTDDARQIWLKWKESHATDDDWLTPEETGFAPATTRPATTQGAAARPPISYTWGTINCLAVTASGDIAGVTTTSGLSYKIPGRVGDSPIIGAGLYVDNAIGAAGSTGRGEANLQNCSSFLIVELMRPREQGGRGLSPQDACLEVLKRIADHTEPRLRDKQGRPDFGVTFYALDKSGRFAGASMWGTEGKDPPKYAVHDGKSARLVECVTLFLRR